MSLNKDLPRVASDGVGHSFSGPILQFRMHLFRVLFNHLFPLEHSRILLLHLLHYDLIQLFLIALSLHTLSYIARLRTLFLCRAMVASPLDLYSLLHKPILIGNSHFLVIALVESHHLLREIVHYLVIVEL